MLFELKLQTPISGGVEGSGKQKVYHRFQSNGLGTYHWNGSTNGTTKKGVPRNLQKSIVPASLN